MIPGRKFARIKLHFQLGELSYSNAGSFQLLKQISYYRHTGTSAPKTALCNKIGKKASHALYSTYLYITQAAQSISACEAGLDKKDKEISGGQPLLPTLLRLNLKGKHCFKQYLLKWWSDREGQGHVSRPGNIGGKPCQILLSATLIITQVLIQINSRQVNSQ